MRAGWHELPSLEQLCAEIECGMRVCGHHLHALQRPKPTRRPPQMIWQDAQGRGWGWAQPPGRSGSSGIGDAAPAPPAAPGHACCSQSLRPSATYDDRLCSRCDCAARQPCGGGRQPCTHPCSSAVPEKASWDCRPWWGAIPLLYLSAVREVRVSVEADAPCGKVLWMVGGAAALPSRCGRAHCQCWQVRPGRESGVCELRWCAPRRLSASCMLRMRELRCVGV